MSLESTSTKLRPRLSEQLGFSLLCTGHTVCVLHIHYTQTSFIRTNLVSLYSVLAILYVSHIRYRSHVDHTVCVSHPLHSDLVYPNNLVSLYSVLDHTVCVSHPLHSDLVYPNNLVSLYSVLDVRHTVWSVLTILYVSHIHYNSDLVYPNNLVSLYSVLAILYVSLTSTTLRPRLSEQLGVSLLCTDHTCMCLTSTTIRPRLSEQLGVSLLCTDHTVCVSHPLQSDLVYPNNLVSLYSVLAILYVSLLCSDHTVCVPHQLQSDLVYPNNLVSLYPVLTILYVSHIHYTQTSFIRTTWCLSTECSGCEQLGVSLPCTDHTVCVPHQLHSDLVYPNNLVSLYSVLAILYVSHIHYSTDLVYPNRPRLSEQLRCPLYSVLDHTVCVSHPLQSDLVYPNNLVSLYSVLAILYVSYTHYSQTSFIRTTWYRVSLLCTDHTVYVSYTSTTIRPRLSEQLGVSLLCTDHTVCVSHPLHSDLVYKRGPNNLVSLYSVLTILYVSHIHSTLRPRLSEQTWCLSTLY